VSCISRPKVGLESGLTVMRRMLASEPRSQWRGRTKNQHHLSSKKKKNTEEGEKVSGRGLVLKKKT